ncbi:MAG: Zn-dependent protease [Anaerolineaceae bacterium]|nr:Zn-dependent protease [Anaerolineaceae bacterium]
MTYSIIARDPETGQFGVAVQTFNLAVGTWVPWAVGGVGVVATQAVAERRYGTSGLDLMRGGYTSVQTLNALLAADPKRAYRQVSMIDSAGNIATHTGEACLPEAGSFVGDTFCTQANMMLRDTVWPAMAAAYEAAEGDLADRLLAALDAAQAEGGDMRGQQTAALLIVDNKPSPIPLIDLRVDHDPNPLVQLRRLLRLHRAYTLEYKIVDLAENGETEPIYDLVQQVMELAPHEPYLHYLCALHLERDLGLREEATAVLQSLIQTDPRWRAYLERELKAGQTSPWPELDPQLLKALMKKLTAENAEDTENK